MEKFHAAEFVSMALHTAMVASTVHVNMVTYGDLINVLIQCRVIQF